MSGDIFLPVIHKYLFSSSTALRTTGEDVINILKHNRHIAKNYLIMQLRRELHLRTKYGDAADRIVNVFAENMNLYEAIFQCRLERKGCQPDSRYERLFGTYWEFSSDTNEVIFHLGSDHNAEEVRFPLPTPREIASGFYGVTQEHEELIHLRSRIIDYALRNDLQLFSDQVDFCSGRLYGLAMTDTV